MFYSDDVIEEVRARNDVVDLIGNYIKLTKKGSSHFGLCPFHNEKSPSFSVSRDKQMYYCFGCGAGGNVITFVMEYENYSFLEAVKYLAERAGIKLPEVEVTEEQKRTQNRRQQLLDMNKIAAQYFYYQLKGKNGSQARDYFEKRQLSSDTVAHFGLGYANPYRDDLYQFLKKKGYEDGLLKDSGLVSIDEKKGAHDKFWNRVMFPIMDVNNKVIGFGGRVLGDGTPKYLNSPETLLFDKSRNLYGLNFARTSRQSFMIICEGYMDVIAMHQAGFTNAVASLGTAFTLQHGVLLKRYTEEVILAYDSDEAGIKAALRAIPILRSAGLRIRVLHMTPYKDPDEFIKNLGTEAFKERIEKAENSFMFEVSVLEKSYNLGDPDGKTRFFNEVAKRLLAFSQELERNNYIEAVARHYAIPFDDLQKLVNRYGMTMPEREIVREERSFSRRSADSLQYPEALLASQQLLLTWLVNDTSLLKKIKPWVGWEDFVHPVYQKVCQAVYESIESTGQIVPGQIINLFQEKEEQKLVASIFNSNIAGIEDKNAREKALTETVVKIKRNHLDEMSRQIHDLGELQNIIKLKSDLQNLHISL
ncbi:MAG: DNA primase [Clostridia bacterium]|nr:DNA primase [Lachnospiraceae bacterium]NCB99272.1 DNA primase [Clostridia bacterium]NCD01421.1 DNA primase [Clostridia bacterium]